ncbi:MAG: phosphopantetheine-binding protein [Ilumatobacteraceae bacterium]
MSASAPGDLGRLDPATGFIHVVGRLARRVKPFGFRIDLDDVERHLAEAGIAADLAGDDDLIVAAAPNVDPVRTIESIALATGLPTSRIVAFDRSAPRAPNGKIDYPALLLDAHVAVPQGSDEPDTDAPTDRRDVVRSTLTAVLGVDMVADDDTFVRLGGDSLSYIECSIRLERALGSLPSDWHLRSVDELAADRAPKRLARVDTTVVLRAVGILAVVSTHMRLWHVPGGSHLLLGVVGYNLARFTLPIADTRARVVAGLRTVARVAVPTVAWTLVFMLFGQYTWHTLTLVNNYVGPRSHAGNHWHFWFVEVFVHLVVLTLLLTSIPAVRRLDLRFPYLFPLGLLGLVLTLRMDWADLGDWYNLRFRTHAVAWFFVLGWLIQRSTRRHQQVLTSAIALVTAYGVFQNPRREYFIATGFVLLVWVNEIPLPRRAVAPVATIAAASMWILISHFMIWPPMKDVFIVEVAYPLTVLASIGVWWTFTRAPRVLRERLVPVVRSRSVAAAYRPATSLV